MTVKQFLILIALIMFTSACASLSSPELATVTALPSKTHSPATLTFTPLPTDTLIPTDTPTPIPTYTVLRGEVIADHLACRYGPGWPYLYFFGLLKGNRLEVIGRLEDAKWIFVQAIGGQWGEGECGRRVR